MFEKCIEELCKITNNVNKQQAAVLDVFNNRNSKVKLIRKAWYNCKQ